MADYSSNLEYAPITEEDFPMEDMVDIEVSQMEFSDWKLENLQEFDSEYPKVADIDFLSYFQQELPELSLYSDESNSDKYTEEVQELPPHLPTQLHTECENEEAADLDVEMEDYDSDDECEKYLGHILNGESHVLEGLDFQSYKLERTPPLESLPDGSKEEKFSSKEFEVDDTDEEEDGEDGNPDLNPNEPIITVFTDSVVGTNGEEPPGVPKKDAQEFLGYAHRGLLPSLGPDQRMVVETTTKSAIVEYLSWSDINFFSCLRHLKS